MSTASPDVEILDYSPALLPHFVAINEAWVRKMFVLEQADREVLANAESLIVDRGGKILFARHRDLGVVGTCALLKRSEGSFELTKMGVEERVRGLKIGDLLLRHAIATARAMAVKNLFLLTSKQCQAAIHLYRKHGFLDDEDIMREYGPLYRRCDVAMRYWPERRR